LSNADGIGVTSLNCFVLCTSKIKFLSEGPDNYVPGTFAQWASMYAHKKQS